MNKKHTNELDCAERLGNISKALLTESERQTFEVEPITKILSDLRDFFMNKDNVITKFEFLRSGIINSLHSFICSPQEGDDNMMGRVMIARLATLVSVFSEMDSTPLERMIQTFESNIHESLLMPQISQAGDIHTIMSDL